jgi:hypothetical protein
MVFQEIVIDVTGWLSKKTSPMIATHSLVAKAGKMGDHGMIISSLYANPTTATGPVDTNLDIRGDFENKSCLELRGVSNIACHSVRHNLLVGAFDLVIFIAGSGLTSSLCE